MNVYDIDYSNAFKQLVFNIEKGGAHGVAEWKIRHRRFLFDNHDRCNPVDLLGTLAHHAHLERYTLDQMTQASMLFMSMLIGEDLHISIRAKLVRVFGPITKPQVIAPMFKHGGSFQFDVSELNNKNYDVYGPIITLNSHLNHIEGYSFVLGQLSGWDAFDRKVRDLASINGRDQLLAAVINHPGHRKAMQKRVFSIDPEAMRNEDLLRFAIKFDKIIISNLGATLKCVVDQNLDDLVDEAAERVIKRAHGFKSEKPIHNLKAIHLYLRNHCQQSPVREGLLMALNKEISTLEISEVDCFKHKALEGPAF